MSFLCHKTLFVGQIVHIRHLYPNEMNFEWVSIMCSDTNFKIWISVDDVNYRIYFIEWPKILNEIINISIKRDIYLMKTYFNNIQHRKKKKTKEWRQEHRKFDGKNCQKLRVLWKNRFEIVIGFQKKSSYREQF